MNGIIIINKPKNYTSHDIVYKIKKIAKEKVGHTGTLDPLAQGVLPILIGKATKCSAYLTNHDKTYQVELKLGIKTETADSEGKILQEKKVSNEILKRELIEKVLISMIGKQEQTPPIYSAIKLNGKKLYEYARKGQNVELKPREITIYSMKLNSINVEQKIINFTVECSKGTYIRSLCEDVAKKMGTIGYMSNLVRTRVGKFLIQDSISIEDLIYANNPKEKLEEKIITIEELFKNMEKIELNQKKLNLFLNGVKIYQEKPDGIYRIYCNMNFIGIGNIKDRNLKREVVL